MSIFLKEKEYLLTKIASYKECLITSELKQDIKNSIKAEEKMNPITSKVAYSSIAGLLKVLNRYENIDLVETGNIKIHNYKELEKLLDKHKVICELNLTPVFLGIKCKFGNFLTLKNQVIYLSKLLDRNIKYYEKNKKICCYIY